MLIVPYQVDVLCLDIDLVYHTEPCPRIYSLVCTNTNLLLGVRKSMNSS